MIEYDYHPDDLPTEISNSGCCSIYPAVFMVLILFYWLVSGIK